MTCAGLLTRGRLRVSQDPGASGQASGQVWIVAAAEGGRRVVQVVAKLKQLQADAETIVAFLSNESAVQQLKQDKAYNLRFLQEV